MPSYKEISSNQTNLDVTTVGSEFTTPTEVYIANKDLSNALTVDSLIIADSSNTQIATIIRGVVIPVGTALSLNSKSVGFNPKIHKLRISTSGSAAASIIIT